MKRIANYISNSYEELMTKVSWPTWDELRESTIIVLISSLLFAIVVYLADLGIHQVLNLFYSMFN